MTPVRVSTRQNELVWMDTGVDEVGLSRATLRGKTESGSGVVEVGKVARLLASFVGARMLHSLGQSGGRNGIWADPVRRNGIPRVRLAVRLTF